MTIKFHFTAALAVSIGLFASAASAGEYVLAAAHRIEGEGGWDYLSYDVPSNRLFIARATRVQVVDPDSGQLLGEIGDTPGVHGVALAGDLGKGYASNGRDKSITVFDLKTLRTLRKIATPVGDNPDFIAYDPVSRRVIAFNGGSHNASVIDAVSDELVATIALGGKPEAAVADGRGHMFVDIEDRNELAAIDTRAAKIDAVWAVPVCNEPSGLAIDVDARRLFVACHNRVLAVVNADSGAIVAHLPIGEGVDAAAFDAGTRQVFSSQGNGTLTIIREEGGDRYSVQQTAATGRGARTMALNPTNHDIYLVRAEFDDAPPAVGQLRLRRNLKPGTFTLLVMRPQAD